MIDGFQLTMNLGEMSKDSFDVILSMDWLAQYRVVVDCYNKKVTLFSHNEKVIVYKESSKSIRLSPILKACIGGSKKLEFYGSMFAIDGEMGTLVSILICF